MPTPQSTESFLHLLEKSELLTREQLAAVVERERLLEQASAAAAAERLVSRGVLTQFQSSRLLEGQYRGLVIDHYKLTEILGVGGMGYVYRAEDLQGGGAVALKVISERHRYEPGMLARFQLEAAAGKKLDHPNIVTTHEIGHTGGLYGELLYFVMEYVEGISLQELVTLQGPLPHAQACDVAAQVATGLHFAHKAGLIHRDIKPSNLLVERSGQVKILDFGLALLQEEQEDEFSLAMIFGHECLGSADYMAPEQSLDSFTVDARADVYSLGGTLYFALTGNVPFPDERTSEKLLGHRERRPTPVQEIVRVPGMLSAMVERMMAKRPEDRFQSAGNVARTLARYAKRREVPFDFPRILHHRADEARRRIAQDEKHARSAASSLTRGFESTACSRTSRVLPKTAHRRDEKDNPD